MPNIFLRFISLLIFIILFACGKPNYDSSKYDIKIFNRSSIPEVVELNGENLSFDGLIDPWKIILLDTLLLVSDRYPDDRIYLLDPFQKRIIKKFGKPGHGPGEIDYINFITLGVDDESFWAYSANNKLFSKFFINDNQTDLASLQIRQTEKLFITKELVWSSDTTFMTTRTDHKEKFVEYHVNGDTIRSYGTWEGMVDRVDIPMNVLASLHQGLLKSSKDRSTFMFACIARDMIEILDKKTGKIISIRGPDNEIPPFTVDYSPGYPMLNLEYDTRYCYLDSYYGDQYIYALFSGRRISEVKQSGKYCNEVFVFDKQGNIKKQYKLDYSVRAFCVDEKNRKLYAVSYDKEPNIIEFTL